MSPATKAAPDQGNPASTAGERRPPTGGAWARGLRGAGGRLLAHARRSAATRAGLAAAVLACVVFCLGSLLAGSYPLGSHTRNIVDLGNQYLPYHAYWRKMLLGGADGDLFVNWNSGFGSNFLGDFGTYLSSPFDLLVVLFPADHVELALYVITTLKITAAAAAMAVFLLRLRRGPWQVAAVLGVAYALSGWTLDNGATVPMWLDGLTAFPLLCLVGEWARAGRRPVLGPLVVGLAWVANFYTAYMATIGAAIVLLIRLFTADESGRRRLRGLLHAARGVLIGIGLAAPLVLVIFKATKVADPTPVVVFDPVAWRDFAARLLPATTSTATPALFIGTPALVLALTLPFNRAVAARTRAVWSAALVLVALSLNWEPTHLIWHAGASPNGIPYRQTFVLCGLLVIAAWLSGADGLPALPALLAGGALVLALAAAGHGREVVDRWSYPAFAAALLLGILAAAALLLARRRGPGARVLPVVALALFVLAQGGETAVTGMRVAQLQLKEVSWSPRLGPAQDDMAAAVAARDDWPRTRTDPGNVPGGNDEMVVGGQGAEYYSSLTADDTSWTLSELGFGYYAKGRHTMSLDNPVTDAIFSIGTRMHSQPLAPPRTDQVPRAVTTSTTSAVPPLVTVRGGLRLVEAKQHWDPSAFVNQETVLGAKVYDPAAPIVRTDPAKGSAVLTTTCTPGAQVYFWAPQYTGDATLAGGRPVGFDGHLPAVRGAMQAVGTVPASGTVKVALSFVGHLRLPQQSIGCLVRSRLDAAVRQLTATGATDVRVDGHTLTADLPAGSTGTAVVAVPRISGWRCSAGDGHATSARTYWGLIAVPLDGGADSISCSFQPPGLRLGGAVGAGALVCLVATGWWYRRAGRRAGARAEAAVA
ncbi:YfhO family protein [Actinacidiphila acidipaludis]|uniref:YfhO family protein n=1 Tax=Actinacidiphila acidipaludis TaxID=2873382 RepID=UPI0027DF4581|nr:YfhO family protein [Streptomyces acidipaludis]